jgi:para-nitrobenzyl esterase
MVRNPEYVENWLGFLPRLKDEDTYKRIVKYGALAWKQRGVDSLANYMTAAGNTNVYAYRFDWDEEPSQAGFDLSVALGAAHGLEIAFAFDEFDGGLGVSYIYPNDDAQFALADSMTSYWSEFAYSGDPGRGREGKQPEWLAWGANGKRSIILDSPADQGIFMDDEEVTLQSIKAALAEDSGFPDGADKCRIYARNFRGDDFVQSEYAALDPACGELDPTELARF